MRGQDKKETSKINRACDICRKKKIRCDGAEQSDGRCTQCSDSKVECTYMEGPTRRTPPKWYIERLETRLEKVEALLEKLHPGVFFPELGPPVERGCWINQKSDPYEKGLLRSTGLLPPKGHIMTTQDMTLGMENLQIADGRYYGKTSTASFIQAAVGEKPEYKGKQPSEWAKRISQNCRRSFWQTPSWEYRLTKPLNPIPFVYPPRDLLDELVNHFFHHANILFPVLHRPTFEAQLRDDLQHRDMWFGLLVLFVCAAGARWSDDPRARETESQHSAGWVFFEEGLKLPRACMEPVNLNHIQAFLVMALFMMGSSSPLMSWSLAGFGIRGSQDVGAHRKRKFDSPIEEELWKRAFWCLVVMDRVLSSSLGRSCGIQIEEIEVELPLEVDDEYWSAADPMKALQQPSGIPSKMQFFNCYESLTRIITTTQRAIFADTQGKFSGPSILDWQQDLLAQMDSSLNQWLDNLPQHLKWDPDQPNRVFFIQSALLHTTYYQSSILVHRAFVPSTGGPIRSTSPSLAICTNAARLCSRVVDTLCRRENDAAAPWAFPAAFTAGLVLLLNIWGQNKAGGTVDYSPQLEDVHRCMDVLCVYERRWMAAGRLWDILHELASVGDFPVPEPRGHKRDRSELGEGDERYERLQKIPRSNSDLSWPKTTSNSDRSFTDSSSESPASIESMFNGLGAGASISFPPSEPTSAQTHMSNFLSFFGPTDRGLLDVTTTNPDPTSLGTVGGAFGVEYLPDSSGVTLDEMGSAPMFSNTLLGVESEIWQHFMASPSLWDLYEETPTW